MTQDSQDRMKFASTFRILRVAWVKGFGTESHETAGMLSCPVNSLTGGEGCELDGPFGCNRYRRENFELKEHFLFALG